MPVPSMQMLNSAGSRPWFGAWDEAYARQAAGAGQAHIVCFGDSVSQGYYATEPYYLNGWAGRIGTEFTARNGQATGTGVIRTVEEFGLTDARTSSAGTWNSETSGGFFSQFFSANSSGDTYTLGPITCTAFKIMYLTAPGGGTFTATIDGGAPTTYSCNAAAGVEFVELDAGASGSHTLVLAGDAGVAYPVAVEAVHNETTGVKVSRIALSGAECSELVVDATGISSRQCYLELAPNLAIIAFGLNEALNGTTTATFKTHLTTLVTDMKALDSSVLIVASPPPNTSFISEVTWSTFRVAMEEVADANDVGFLDLADYWTSYAANTPYYFDNVHPSDAGHADYARIIADFVVETVDPSAPITFIPTDISNLAGWWDASDDASFTYSSGTLVSQWNDRSGNVRHFTQGATGNQPTRSVSVGALKAVQFDGIDNWMTAGDTLDLGTNSLSVFAVCRVNTPSGSNTLIGKYKVTPNDGSWLLYFNSSTLSTIFDPGTLNTTTGAYTTTDARVVGTVVDRVAGTVTQRTAKANNGTNTFTPDSASSRDIAQSLYLGALRNAADSGFQATFWFSGYVCEIVVYLKALSAGEIAQVEDYLDAKWKVL